MAVIYLAALAVSTGCMAVLDHRFRLVFWRAPRIAASTLVAGLVFFLVWDLVSISLGHYYAGDSPVMTGIMLAPELPLEEIFFIVFLGYLTLVLRGLFALVLGNRAHRRNEPAIQGQPVRREPEPRGGPEPRWVRPARPGQPGDRSAPAGERS